MEFFESQYLLIEAAEVLQVRDYQGDLGNLFDLDRHVSLSSRLLFITDDHPKIPSQQRGLDSREGPCYSSVMIDLWLQGFGKASMRRPDQMIVLGFLSGLPLCCQTFDGIRFGTITSTRMDMRVLQFALKLIF